MRAAFVLSLPERLVRSLVAVVGGTIHESAQFVLPRLVRRSRLYEASAKNLLRISIELVGGVEAAAPSGDEPGARVLAVRKGAGNVVELGSIAAFGFSPLWLLAAASDVAHGSRVYLDSLVDELKAADVLAPDAEFESVDQLLSAFEGGSGTAARLIDIPPRRAGRAPCLGRRAEAPRRRPAGPDGAGLALPRSAAGSGAGAPLAARGLAGDRAGLPALGQVGVARPPLRALPRGLEAAPRRGLRRLRMARVAAVRACAREPLRPATADLDRTRARQGHEHRHTHRRPALALFRHRRVTHARVASR